MSMFLSKPNVFLQREQFYYETSFKYPNLRTYARVRVYMIACVYTYVETLVCALAAVRICIFPEEDHYEEGFYIKICMNICVQTLE